MSDSIDRVFVKAISTIRTLSTRTGYGSLPRPPLENRIRLYGLYKQATEGDVTGVMQRPTGNSYEEENAKRKWDAWKEEEGISKTEAKRRYISFLIETMKLYASGTHEARELLGELEYLWDQIKDVDPSLNDSVHDITGVTGNSPLSFLSTGFGGDIGSNSVSYSGSAAGVGYDSFNESYLNHNIYQSGNRHVGGNNNIRNELRDVQLLKKEVNLALRRLNDEIVTKNHNGNNNNDNKKRSSLLISKILIFLFGKTQDGGESSSSFSILLLKRVFISLFKLSLRLVKKIVIELFVLIILINLIKYKNGIDLNFSINNNNDKNVGFWQKLLVLFLKHSKILKLFNFSKIYINVD